MTENITDKNRVIIAFFKVPLKIKYEALEDVIDKNQLLHEALIQYMQEFANDGIEVWKIENNIAVTELGYYVALEQTKELLEHFPD